MGLGFRVATAVLMLALLGNLVVIVVIIYTVRVVDVVCVHALLMIFRTPLSGGGSLRPGAVLVRAPKHLESVNPKPYTPKPLTPIHKTNTQ